MSKVRLSGIDLQGMSDDDMYEDLVGGFETTSSPQKYNVDEFESRNQRTFSDTRTTRNIKQERNVKQTINLDKED